MSLGFKEVLSACLFSRQRSLCALLFFFCARGRSVDVPTGAGEKPQLLPCGRTPQKRARLFGPGVSLHPFQHRLIDQSRAFEKGQTGLLSRVGSALSFRPFPLPIAVMICSMLEHMMLMFALFEFEATVPRPFSATLPPHPHPPPPSRCKLKHQVFLKRFHVFSVGFHI